MGHITWKNGVFAGSFALSRGRRGQLLRLSANEIAGIKHEVPCQQEAREGQGDDADEVKQGKMAHQSLEKVGHDDGKCAEPMGTHDVNFVETEAENDVNQHVECPEREGKPHQTGVPTAPYSAQEE